MQRHGIIYKITNKINGKVYIGQTTQTLSDRWSKHKYRNSHSKLIRLAIKKYGIENLTIEEFCSCFSIDSLNLLEERIIAQFNCITPHGYNLTSGGDSAICTEENRQNRSISGKRHWSDPQAKAKHIEALNGVERREKISASSKSRWNDPEYRKRVSEAIRKGKASPEHRAHMSKVAKEWRCNRGS
jgi:group I intron endonuclease